MHGISSVHHVGKITFSVAEIGFNIIFCVELVLRAVAGDLFDCNVKNAKWRFLDLVMGLESFAELAMSPMGFSLSHVRNPATPSPLTLNFG